MDLTTPPGAVGLYPAPVLDAWHFLDETDQQ